MRHPDPRTIRRALGVLERLPHEALAELTERLIDRLDAAEVDLDLESDDFDACPAEDMPVHAHPILGAGDAEDAEESGDEHEPDDDDCTMGEDEPAFLVVPVLSEQRA